MLSKVSPHCESVTNSSQQLHMLCSLHRMALEMRTKTLILVVYFNAAQNFTIQSVSMLFLWCQEKLKIFLFPPGLSIDMRTLVMFHFHAALLIRCLERMSIPGIRWCLHMFAVDVSEKL
ncbi:hypothetical protein M0R45_007774 [Rubus argutus]|uniref:Uncharacterized protein n=1 Tax=Rubus argutus TaxID=59490 RepID=A0AAW1Y1A1_RUBAR